MSGASLVILTAASTNHASCLRDGLFSLDTFEDAPVILCDLGLTPDEHAAFRGEGRTVIAFPFAQYPAHFGRSGTRSIPHAWKPVIIHDTLERAGDPSSGSTSETSCTSGSIGSGPCWPPPGSIPPSAKRALPTGRI